MIEETHNVRGMARGWPALAPSHPDAEPGDSWHEVNTKAQRGVLSVENGGRAYVGLDPSKALDAPPERWQAVDLNVFLSEPDIAVPFTWAGVIPKVGVTTISGPPKVGKSLLVGQVGLIAAGGGGELLGRRIEACRVLYVTLEGSKQGLRWRLRRQMEHLGIEAAEIAFLYRPPLRLEDPRTVDLLRAEIARTGAGMVIVDPLNRAHRVNEDRANEMTPVMDALSSIAFDYECAIPVVHHLGKPSEGRASMDRIRGSGAIRSGSDANLILERDGGQLRLDGEFKDAEPLTAYLSLDPDTLTLEAGEAPAGKVPPDALRAFVDERRQVNASQVMARFGVSRNTAKAELNKLALDTAYDSKLGQLWLSGRLDA